MVPKTKRVPAALHSELTEYASLLRALRTGATLDLSAHLVRDTQERDLDEESEVEEGDSGTGDGEDEIQESPIATSPPASAPSEGFPGLESDNTLVGKGKKRMREPRIRRPANHDTWTRWPLLPADVHPSEWSLEEEVTYIARGVMRERRRALRTEQRSQDEIPESEEEVEGQDEDVVIKEEEMQHSAADIQKFSDEAASSSDESENEDDSSIFRHALAISTQHHLRMLLTLSAIPIPRVAYSMRGRLAPLDWVGVLNAVGAGAGPPGIGFGFGTEPLVSPDALARVRTRLEAIYGPYQETHEVVQPQRVIKAETATRPSLFSSELCPSTIFNAVTDSSFFPSFAFQ